MQIRKAERGFSLVELAISIIVIGVLLTAIVRGQEVITTAKIAVFLSDVKSYESAIESFRSSYGAYPGDLVDISLLSCSSSDNCAAGNGNGYIVLETSSGDVANPAWNQARAAFNDETFQFWKHLAVTELVTDVNKSASMSASATSWEDVLPKGRLGGGFDVFYDSDFEPNAIDVSSAGHYLRFSLDSVDQGDATFDGVITPSIAMSIDKKIDDGLPYAGRVMAAGDDCAPTTSATVSSVYLISNDEDNCTLFFKFGGRRR